MGEKRSLAERAEKIFRGLKLGEDEIPRELVKLSSISHHIVTYPPLESAARIGADKLFNNPKTKHSNLALYVHAPFCTGRCIYCSYLSLPNAKENVIESYLNALKKEIELALEFPEVQHCKVTSLYFGGGTPTFLSSERLAGLADFLKEKFRFGSNFEFTCEASPETIVGKEGAKKLDALLDSGASRLSIGAQSFNDKILRFIGRRHNANMAIESFNLAKSAGFESINVDLIPCLPLHNTKIWEEELHEAEKLLPPSITAYPLTLKANTPLYNLWKQNPAILPGAKEELLINIMAIEKFSELGYVQNPRWWFLQKPKFVYRQQLHKWQEMGEQMAFGVAGYSYINNCQYYNLRDFNKYIDTVNSGKLPVWKGQILDKKEQMRRQMVFGIKIIGGVSKEHFRKKFGISIDEAFPEVLQKLEKLGLIKNGKKAVKYTYKGMLFADEVSREFFKPAPAQRI